MPSTGRPLKARSKLADLIRDDGRPAYQIAGEARLAHHQLLAYYHRRKPIPLVHLRRLCAVLECEPDDIVEDR